MRAINPVVVGALLVCIYGLAGAGALLAQETAPGEPLDPALYGPSYIESMDAAVARNRVAPPPKDMNVRGDQHGVWMVPSIRATCFPHSGLHNAVNTWGDTRMGIGFPGLVDVDGAYFAGQSDLGVWTTGIRVRGYREGGLVQETDWFRQIGREPRWFAMNLRGVDRIEIEAIPVLNGGGWYAMDDLTFKPAGSIGQTTARKVVLGFEDLDYGTKLAGSGYGGLTWETGTGVFETDEGVHSPMIPAGVSRGGTPPEEGPRDGPRDNGTPPTLVTTFQGVIRGDAGSMSFPPDTDGAIGPNHYVETVNRNFAVYDKTTGAELVNILLGSFLPGSNGDPRVLFDQHSGRWIVLVTDFSAGAHDYLAVSSTDDPTGTWFKTSFVTAQGSDSGCWPDYPTLGVDANGIYTASYMVDCGGMTIFAINKAPLVASPPSLGAVTAFRNLPYEDACQPAHTYGSPAGEYVVSTPSSGTTIRIRRINPPLTSPTLTELGTVSVPAFSDPPNAPALGSSTPLNTVDARLMMSVYRDGAIWTAHTISVSGRAGCRWYQLNVSPLSLLQQGTVANSSLYYFFPSIMVNQFGHVAMGFTGSNASQYAACYYTGRVATDPPGEMAPPVMYKPGTGPQNNVDSYGRNRWGDYSYTTLDPADDSTFWMIQEYGHANNIWGTYVAVLSTGPHPPAAAGGEAGTLWNTPVTINLQASDDGMPDPPGVLAYVIATMPQHGWLTDPAADVIESAPYTLIGGGSQVTYAPHHGYFGADGFAFKTNDGGVPPEGGDSNTATVLIEVTLPNRQVVHEFRLDSDPGWTTQGQWAFGQPTGRGTHGLDPASGYTGINVYGYNLNGDYANGMPAPLHLVTTAMDCSRNIGSELRFRRWLGVEGSQFDQASIEASADGLDWTTRWQHTGEAINEPSWSLQTYDISAVADGHETVFIRWAIGPTDATVTYPGWNVDDVEIWAVVNNMCDGAMSGDVNLDGTVDGLDVEPFVAVLLAPYASSVTLGEFCAADADDNGHVTPDDLDDFVALLLGA